MSQQTWLIIGAVVAVIEVVLIAGCIDDWLRKRAERRKYRSSEEEEKKQMCQAAREAREAERKRKRERKEEQKRKELTDEETEIGSAILGVLCHERELRGRSDISIKPLFSLHTPTVDNPYGIIVKSPAGIVLVRVTVNLQKLWNRQIEVRVGDHVQWPAYKEHACRQVKYLLDEFKIFG